MEIGQEPAGSKDYAVSVDSERGVRMKTEYRSWRRQACFLQFITVFFCLICCSFTLMFQTYTSRCKESHILDTPVIEMQKQTLESSSEESSDEIYEMAKLAPFTSLSVDGHGHFSGPGNVVWGLTTDSVNDNKYFTLDSDKESLIVRQDGTYKVALQIMYRGLPNWLTGETYLQHEIHRYTAGYPKAITVLVYMDTVNFKAIAWKKTLFSEGVFPLTAGDKLKVWSHNRTLIDIRGQSLWHAFILPVSRSD